MLTTGADGGGIQGLAALVTLREFMRRIQAKLGLSTTPRPCEYFDLMAGTGIGGLVVIMLGRLRMTIDEAMDWFNEIVTLVFGSKKLWGNGAFKASVFVEVVGRMAVMHAGSATAPMIEPQASESACKTVVCAMSADSMVGALPTLFRSYESTKNRAPDCTIVQAARATTAKPGIFKPVEIVDHGVRLSYIDGGLGCNNPTARMLDEAEFVFPSQHAQSIISLGTGQTHPSSIPSPSLIQRVLPTQATEAMEGIATDCERTSQEIHTRFQHVPGVYFRFNVGQGLQDIQHSELEKLPKVAAHTISHHQKVSVGSMLNQAVIATVEGKALVATEQLSGRIHSY
ncbi:FabD/lysophospholipase-like protein [Ceratobasidium sp. AG-I]|nr:FabD/lysophospholipase-like protein [Ceratobasidium sp. AG-I]